MRVWTVHLPPPTDRAGRPSRRSPVLVQEGFSWGAFLFGPLWLLAHRLWLSALLWTVSLLAAALLLPAAAAGVLDSTSPTRGRWPQVPTMNIAQ